MGGRKNHSGFNAAPQPPCAIIKCAGGVLNSVFSFDVFSYSMLVETCVFARAIRVGGLPGGWSPWFGGEPGPSSHMHKRPCRLHAASLSIDMENVLLC